MTITIKSNPDGVTGAIQVNGVDKVSIGASGITAGSFAPNSIDAAAAALAFSGANQSLANSGYQKLPSGLIIQWGISNSIVLNGGVINNFPIAFPNACFQLVGSPSGATYSTAASSFAVQLLSATQFQLWCWGTTGSYTVRWIAIGH